MSDITFADGATRIDVSCAGPLDLHDVMMKRLSEAIFAGKKELGMTRFTFDRRRQQNVEYFLFEITGASRSYRQKLYLDVDPYAIEFEVSGKWYVSETDAIRNLRDACVSGWKEFACGKVTAKF